MNESDLRSDVHYLGSSENKAWKKKKKKIQACTRFEPMTSAIPVQIACNQVIIYLPWGKSFQKRLKHLIYLW